MEFRSIGQDLRRLASERFEALRQADGGIAKIQTAGAFAQKERVLIELRHNIEKQAIEARHVARGTVGGWEQKVDLDRAQFRRAGAENSIQRREDKFRERLENWKRPDVRFTRKSDHTYAQGRERLVQALGRAAKSAERATSTAMGSLSETWLPEGMKVLAKAASISASRPLEVASSLLLSATGVGKALSIALKATDLAMGLAKAASTKIQEIER